MFQFTTLYYRVDDEQRLEDFFSNTHLQLAEQLPGLVKSEVSRITGQPLGESRFHLAYSLYFATEDSFRFSLVSEPGMQMIQALRPWVEAGLIVWYYADAFEEIVIRKGSKLADEDLLPKTDDQSSETDHSSSGEDAAGI
jgi:uncharacterized protein (TIGR02118 family)